MPTNTEIDKMAYNDMLHKYDLIYRHMLEIKKLQQIKTILETLNIDACIADTLRCVKDAINARIRYCAEYAGEFLGEDPDRVNQLFME